MQLPCPLPHPLAWWSGAPSIVVEALEWVVGVEWPDGNEKLVWDHAEHWYAAATSLGPTVELTVHGGQTAAEGFGGSTTELGAAVDQAWLDIAGTPESDLQTLVVLCHDVGELVEACGCDIQAAKIEMYVELGIMALELLATLAAAVATLGAASAAAPAITAVARWSIQQIFRRLLHQLLTRAVRAGAREAVERIMKKATEKRLARFALGAGRHAGEEGLEEVATDYATQNYQISQGRRDGYDTTSLLLSAGGGAAGGVFGGLAHLGPHAEGGLKGFGEVIVRGAGGEVLAETGAGIVTGQGLPDAWNLARSLSSGAFSGGLDGTRESLADRRAELLTAHAGGLADLPAGVDLTQLAGPIVDPLGAGGSGPVAASGLDGGTPTTTGTSPAYPAGPSIPGASDPPSSTVDIDRPAPPTADVHRPAPSTTDVDAPAPSTADTDRPALSTTDVDGPGRSTAGITGPAPAAADRAGLGELPAGPDGSMGITTYPPGTDASIVDSAGRGATADLAAAAPGPQVPPVPAGNPPTPAPTDPATTGPIASGPIASGPTASGPTASGPTASGPTASGPVASGPTVTGPVASVPTAAVPTAGGLPASAPEGAGPSPGSAPSTTAGGPHAVNPPSAGPGPAGPTTAGPGPVASSTVGPTLGVRGRSLVHQADEIRRDRVDLWGQAEHLRREELRIHLNTQVRAELDLDLDRALDLRRQALDGGRLDLADRLDQRVVGPARLALADLDRRIQDAWRAPAGLIAVPAGWHPVLNNDYAATAPGGVDTDDRSALTGDDGPLPVEATRAYGRPGGHREPLRIDQEVLEELIPRDSDGRPQRTPNPFDAWFERVNDSGPGHDPTRGLNCVDCVLSLFDTWLHGRPRVAAPRTFDAYADGDVRRPQLGELGGLRRAEAVLRASFTTTYSVDTAVRLGPEATYQERTRELERALLNAGPGSFAMIAHQWRDGGGHTWAAVNFEGRVVYLDPQHGARHHAPLYDTLGPHGVVRLDVAVVDGAGRPVDVAPDDSHPGWDAADPAGPPSPDRPSAGAALPGTDFVPDGRPADLPALSQAEVDRALVEVRPLLAKAWVRVGDHGRVEILPEQSLDVAMTATIRIRDVPRGQVTAARFSPGRPAVSIDLAPRVAPETVVRAMADGLAGALSTVVGGHPDAAMMGQLDVIATERARLVYRLDHEPDASAALRREWEERQRHLAIEFRLAAQHAGIINPRRSADTEEVAKRRLGVNAGLGDAARACLADLVTWHDREMGHTRPRSLLPLTDEFRRPYETLDSLSYFVTSHAPPAVRRRFEAEVLPDLVRFQQAAVKAFNDVYRECFSSVSKERPLTPSEAAGVATRIQPIVDQTEALLEDIRTWMDQTAVPTLRRAGFERQVELGEHAWREQYQRYKEAADDVVAHFSYLGSPVGFIGSMQNGVRGPHKASIRTDLRNFDLDLYVIQPDDFDARYDAVRRFDTTLPPGEELLSRGKIFLHGDDGRDLLPGLAELTEDLQSALRHRFRELGASPQTIEGVASSEIVLRREPPYRLGARRWTFS